MPAKPLVLLLLCQLVILPLFAQSGQSCYTALRKAGLTLLQKKDYRQAIDKLFAARYCPDKPAKDDLDALIKKTQDAWVEALDDAKAKAEVALDEANQQKIRAESSEKQARQLADKADTLRFYLQGDSTYAVFLKNGKDKFRNGHYPEALYDFATAKFTQETDSINQWIRATQQATQAVTLIKNGYWDSAYVLFDKLPQIDSNDYRNYWQSNIRGSKMEWTNALSSPDFKDNHRLVLTYAVSIPVEIGQLTEVESVQLNGLDLTALPPEIGMLKNLKSVDLARNRLTSLPLSFWQLTQLETLYLNGNRLTKLPPEMANFKKLKKLFLNANQLTQMSKTDWDFLKELKNLEAIHLYGNKLSSEMITYIQTLVPADCEVMGDI